MRRFHSLRSEHGTSEVGTDGRFELGPVPAGPMIVYLQLREKRIRLRRGSFMSIGGGNRVELGRLTVEEEALVERDFTLAEFPGSLGLLVRVNGEPASGLSVRAAGEEGTGFHASGQTDERGLFGPEPAFSGTWTVTVSDREQGWSHVSPVPLAVRPSEETRATIEVTLATARVRFVDKETKQPLVARKVALINGEHGWPIGRTRETDAEGVASFTLTPGEYRFVLDPRGPESFLLNRGKEEEPEARTATLTWTASGPLEEHLEL